MWYRLRRQPLWGILIGALVLRGVAAVGVQWRLDHVLHRPFLIAGDAAGYWELGRTIAAGQPYAIHDPPRRVHRMPGFPLLLALPIKLAGARFLPARLVLAVVGTLACGLVYWLGRELYDATIGHVAAALVAVAPVMVGFSVLILSETAFAAALVGSLIAMTKLVRLPLTPQHRWKGAGLSLLTGVLIAVACYMRPSWLLAAPLFAVVYVAVAENRGRAAARGALVLIGLAAGLAPWTVRNYRITGHFVPTALWVGPSLYDGLNPQATGDSDMRFFDDDRLMQRGFSEYEMDQYYRRKTWEFVRTHPGRTAQLALIKLWRYWKPWPNAAQFGGVGPAVAVAVFFIPAVLLAVWGGWTSWRRFWACALTAGPIVYFCGLHLVFVSSLRYRLPAEYPLCVLSAVGLREFWSLMANDRQGGHLT